MRGPHSLRVPANKKIAMKIETLPFSPVQPGTRARRWRKPAIALVLIVLAGGGWMVMQSKNSPAAGSAQAKGGQDKGPPKVDVYELSSGDVAAISARELA